MRNRLLHTLVVALMVIQSSCNKNNVTDNSDKNPFFEEIKIEKSDFRKIGNKYKYGFKAEVKNISTLLFDTVYTTLNVEFVLENGNIITQKDYESALSMATGFGDYEKSWKPNEIRSIGDKMLVESDFIPDHFKDYPIVKVNAVIKYSCEDLINRTSEDFYTTIDITDIWNDFIGKKGKISNTESSINKNEQPITKETKENEFALIKDIFQKNGKTYISLDIVQTEYTNGNDYKVVNQNPKIRSFEVSETVKIIDKNCRTIEESDYLIKNREIHISKKNDDICMFSSVDGIVMEINFGCWG